MDLNFYSDLSDGNGRSDESEFLDPNAFNGFDAVQKVTALTGNIGNIRTFSFPAVMEINIILMSSSLF